MNYTYVVECADGSLYTGWTTDIERRLSAHNSGKGAKYTRARLPVKLVYFESYSEKSAAMKREAEIKSYSRAKKLELIGR
ncbi:GIY-YIG nuclease superfamily protein [Andreesenia angusta]|uniref:GIY-YIG nuclease superfamily protein n=1 Tax=Andreesenia angusta TaxID=39480 RepID=A0A1S1V9C6_9FIRM|nr:GIY-YIG nuclease family protein [Andreesenia angusta]OHW63221.1 GIY-YIG nuclease superfamily protein [Andreesenia angusta]